LKGFLTTAVILLMLWSGVPFIAGLAVGFLWFIIVLTVFVVVGGVYFISKTDITTKEDYDGINKSLNKLKRSKWKYVYGSIMAGVVSWSAYEHGYVITSYTYVSVIILLGAILIPTFKSLLESKVDDYLASNPDT
jgi:hypothetical protein